MADESYFARRMDLRKRAADASRMGNLLEAIEIHSEIELLDSKEAPLSAQRCSSLNMQAFLSLKSGDYVRAEQIARKCIELAKSAVDIKEEEHATYLSFLAGLLAEGGRFDEAESLTVEAIPIFAKRHPKDSTLMRSRTQRLNDIRSKVIQIYIER